MPPRRKTQDAEAAAVQEHWRSTVNSKLQKLTANLLEAAEASVTKRVVCPHCNHTVTVTVTDIRARTDAIAKLVELGFGKPDAGTAATGNFTVIRRIVVPPGMTGGGEVAEA